MTESIAALAPTGDTARAAALAVCDWAARTTAGADAVAVAVELLDVLGITDLQPSGGPHQLDREWRAATGQDRCPPAARKMLAALHRGPGTGGALAARAATDPGHTTRRVLPRLAGLGWVSSRPAAGPGPGVEWSLTLGGRRTAALAAGTEIPS